MYLSRAMILDVEDLEKVCVPCPEWGGEVYVRVLTAAEREAYEQYFDARRVVMEAQGKAGDVETTPEDETLPPSIRIPLVRMATCTADGDCMFTKDDEIWLAQKSQVVTTRIFDAAWKLNKLGKDEQDEIRKNFGGAQDGASNSDSLLRSA